MPAPLSVPAPGKSLDTLLETEWLLTNGLGGFAMGTAAACNTRRYHALLVAARKPPVDRWALLSQVLVRVIRSDRSFEFPNFEFPGAFHPQGHLALQECRQGVSVEHRWQFDRTIVVQELFLVQGVNTAVIRWRVESGGEPVRLELMPFVANRNFHGLRRKEHTGRPDVHDGGGNVTIRFWEADAPTLHLCVTDARFEHKPDFWYNFLLREEKARGQDHAEDLFVPGVFRADLGGARNSVTMIAGDAPVGPADIDALVAAERNRRAVVVGRFQPADELETRLAAASIDFVVARGAPGSKGAGNLTVIAGYPWFSDWGRDTFISLPGLFLAGRRFDEAREVIRTFAGALKDGLIPNRFEDSGQGADYNTVDAPLWFVHAVGEYHRATRDTPFLTEVGLPTCEKIVEAYRKGTQFDIHETPDGLIEAGHADIQLTWMDARCNNVTFTPRNGCAVEICALWHHAQRVLAELRAAAGRPVGDLEVRAARTAASMIEQFWDPLRGYLADVVQPGGKRDLSLRPNQLFAVSLSPSPLTVSQQQAVVEMCEQRLLTPVGLRSLEPKHPAYCPKYEGDLFKRDGCYHQGTVWGWLLGPYLEALLRAWDFARPAVEKANAVIAGVEPHLRQACLGQFSEIFDADPPHKPRGAPAQAWSVAEILRIRALLRSRRRV